MRKTTVVTIDQSGGRDAGKAFLLTEMPAAKAEKWALRAFLALGRAGVDIPDDVAQQGLRGLAMIGFKMLGGLRFEDAEPLLDEMLTCVQYLPDPTNATIIRPLNPNEAAADIEEVSTFARLRAEVFTLHTGFSLADGVSRLNSGTTPA